MSSSTAGPGLRRTARLLGLASAGLGAAMLRDPRAVARVSGVDDSPTALAVLPAVGARELLHALPLLAGRPGWAWTRVAGDAMDLTAMGVALAHRADGGRPGPLGRFAGLGRHGHRDARYRRLRTATLAVAGLAALDVLTAVRSSRSRGRGAAGDLPTAPWETAIEVSAATTVNKSPDEVYRYWRDLEHLPAFMAHVREVRVLDGDGTRSHWVAEAPGRRRVEWDAEVVEDSPGRVLRWRSLPGADVANTGSVTFTPAPGDRGTEVRVRLAYAQPGGRVGKAVAKLLGEAPDQQVRDDLARFKQVLETGEVVRSAGSPEGPLARRLLRQHPAVPQA